MAQYGVDATSLPAPTGAGANVVAPVEVNGALPRAVMYLGDLFSKGLEQSRKDEAEKRKNSVISSYVKVEATLNDAIATGQMTPAEAAARSRANFNKYAAGYSEYIEDFEKAGRALRGFTEKGEAEKKLQDEKQIRNADIEQARQMGFTFIPGMSVSAENDQIAAAKSSVLANQQLEALYKRNAEARAQGTFDQGVADREAKQVGFTLINNIAGENIQAFQSFGVTLGEQVRSGKMTPEVAQATLAERFSNISASIQAAARTNPELAAPYRTLFGELNEVNKKLIDPKSQAENLEDQLKVIKTKMKLLAMSRPQLAATIVANELLPNNPGLALASSSEAVNAIAFLSNTPIAENQYVPQVAGNPEVEDDVLKMLKGALNDMKGGKIEKKDVAEIQASNSINHILRQTGDLMNQGVSPDRLKGLANFFASPEYASVVASGKIDKQAAGAAYRTFQLLYEPVIIKGVAQKLNQTPTGQSAPGTPKREVPPVQDTVTVEFSGSGVVFKEKPYKKFDIVEARQRQEIINSLKTAQTAINQIIHIGSHMEGNTDYKKYWEEKKHVFFPQYFKEETKEVDTPKNTSRNKSEDKMAESVSDTDTGAGLTAGALNGMLNDLNSGKLTDEQKAQLNTAIKQIMDLGFAGRE